MAIGIALKPRAGDRGPGPPLDERWKQRFAARGFRPRGCATFIDYPILRHYGHAGEADQSAEGCDRNHELTHDGLSWIGRAGQARRCDRSHLLPAVAQQTSDLKLRASLLTMAQRWLALANAEFNPAEPDLWDKTFYHFKIQSKIGRELQSHFELPRQLPHQVSTLLMQIDANS
jgi:hypothetical protein